MFRHSVLDGQCANLELVPLIWMALFCGIGWNGASLFSECQIRIAGRIRGQHVLVAGQGSRYSKFLLGPVNVGDRGPWLWLDQTPQPNRRTKNKLVVGGLVPSGP